MRQVALLFLLPALVIALGLGAAGSAAAQQPAGSEGALPTYKIPPRGAPGSRIGGASRSITTVRAPNIDLLAPNGHTGETAAAAPTLYYFLSGPANQLQLTVSTASQTRPLLETQLAAPGAAGVHAVRLADYRIQLQPGVIYVWSVSISIDPRSPSADIVASAPLMRTAADPALANAVAAAPPQRRAGLLAGAGLWYDAVAAAAETQDLDHHAALDALMDQVGLANAARYDRQAAGR